MGYNKLIFLCNDGEEAINQDPFGWWRACKSAFGRLWNTKKPETFGFGGFCNHWQAVHEAHADFTAVVMVGGNHSTIIGSVYNQGKHSTEEEQIAVLKEILLEKGYRIVKSS